MYLCWLGTFPDSMVQQQHRISWEGWSGWGGGVVKPNMGSLPTRVEVELG